ncbi:hypothetical protein [Limimaricola pyoseonensis]|uniref:RNA polymerase II C-terminal domain phosphatase-like 1/2 n=1 Tax=Limimaricola pyoseonensis TaxID=521013 RepID=A0A1G7J5J6_9RHOB|nr:hypothetical protein [Limimaricola pyoseonensis]SDF20252.1 RNA polymerase II C-terminal domain phosphatase-like 1/2 [Limimaricola pyoseonensis]
MTIHNIGQSLGAIWQAAQNALSTSNTGNDDDGGDGAAVAPAAATDPGPAVVIDISEPAAPASAGAAQGASGDGAASGGGSAAGVAKTPAQAGPTGTAATAQESGEAGATDAARAEAMRLRESLLRDGVVASIGVVEGGAKLALEPVEADAKGRAEAAYAASAAPKGESESGAERPGRAA